MSRQDVGSVDVADGRSLAWQVTGDPESPALLWLHGSTGSRRTAPSSNGARVIAYDRPGFGGSSLHEARDLRSDVADVCALLDAMGVTRVRVLAFSGGAAVGYALAAFAPDRVVTLSVVSGATWPTTPAPPESVLEAAGERLHADPAGAVNNLVANAPVEDRAALQNPALRARLLDGAHDAVIQGPAGWVAEARLLRTDWGFDVSEVRCPVRFWHGTLDDIVPLADAQGTADALTDSTLVRISGAGHFGWMADEDDVVATAVHQ